MDMMNWHGTCHSAAVGAVGHRHGALNVLHRCADPAHMAQLAVTLQFARVTRERFSCERLNRL